MFRGSKIRFMILPGMLKNAPCLRIYKVGEELGLEGGGVAGEADLDLEEGVETGEAEEGIEVV